MFPHNTKKDCITGNIQQTVLLKSQKHKGFLMHRQVWEILYCLMEFNVYCILRDLGKPPKNHHKGNSKITFYFVKAQCIFVGKKHKPLSIVLI